MGLLHNSDLISNLVANNLHRKLLVRNLPHSSQIKFVFSVKCALHKNASVYDFWVDLRQKQ